MVHYDCAVVQHGCDMVQHAYSMMQYRAIWCIMTVL